MQVIHRIEDFRAALEDERRAGRRVGLVPTMGALHEGHVSLVVRAARECEIAAITIFVNPLQFGAGEDFGSYPRTLEADVAKASAAGARFAFAPPIEEMYPGEVATSIRVAGVSERLEGASRPGHFDGVATVVAKLFNIAGPCTAYFGEKDWQQLALVRRMARDLSAPVDIVGCETVREPDGLAMSSRNSYLSAEERSAATVLYRALCAGRDAVAGGERAADAIGRTMAGVIDSEPLATLDYAEAVDAASLEPIQTLSGEVRLLVAARLGKARLIDNMGVKAN
ncbi:MAG: pantoate--beta-alanine ligase [Acidimicrobiia bacterium]